MDDYKQMYCTLFNRVSDIIAKNRRNERISALYTDINNIM